MRVCYAWISKPLRRQRDCALVPLKVFSHNPSKREEQHKQAMREQVWSILWSADGSGFVQLPLDNTGHNKSLTVSRLSSETLVTNVLQRCEAADGGPCKWPGGIDSSANQDKSKKITACNTPN